MQFRLGAEEVLLNSLPFAAPHNRLNLTLPSPQISLEVEAKFIPKLKT